jgi:hypothetical protein
MSKQVEVPQELVEQIAEATSYTEICVREILEEPAIYKHFSDRLLSKAGISAILSEMVGLEDEPDSADGHELYDALKAALQATSTPEEQNPVKSS